MLVPTVMTNPCRGLRLVALLASLSLLLLASTRFPRWPPLLLTEVPTPTLVAGRVRCAAASAFTYTGWWLTSEAGTRGWCGRSGCARWRRCLCLLLHRSLVPVLLLLSLLVSQADAAGILAPAQTTSGHRDSTRRFACVVCSARVCNGRDLAGYRVYTTSRYRGPGRCLVAGSCDPGRSCGGRCGAGARS
ncbi:hypothetical protein V8C86DRAFT_2930691 [Haematococcus lacustris]